MAQQQTVYLAVVFVKQRIVHAPVHPAHQRGQVWVTALKHQPCAQVAGVVVLQKLGVERVANHLGIGHQVLAQDVVALHGQALAQPPCSGVYRQARTPRCSSATACKARGHKRGSRVAA